MNDVHVSWTTSLISEQRSGSSSGSSGTPPDSEAGGSGGHGGHGREKAMRLHNATAFHTPAGAAAGAVAPAAALSDMWSRDIGSDVEARRLRMELGEANASNQQLRAALSQMNRALHL